MGLVEVFEDGKTRTQLLFPLFIPFIKEVFQYIPDKDINFTSGATSYQASNNEAMMYMIDFFQQSRIMLLEPFYDDKNVGGENTATRPLTHNDDDPLDLPFDRCYFENPGTNYAFKMIDQRRSDNGIIQMIDVELNFLLVVEIYGKYSIFSFGKRMDKPHEPARFFTYVEGAVPEETVGHEWLKSCVRHLLTYMKGSVAAVEKVNVKQKARVGGQNIHHKIKEIIHIVPNKKTPIKKYNPSSEIDWSHRWEVRGHWRKISGIGKDRYGQYNRNGFTWVNPHERGPENKPLVKKVRVTRGNENDGTGI